MTDQAKKNPLSACQKKRETCTLVMFKLEESGFDEISCSTVMEYYRKVYLSKDVKIFE